MKHKNKPIGMEGNSFLISISRAFFNTNRRVIHSQLVQKRNITASLKTIEKMPFPWQNDNKAKF